MMKGEFSISVGWVHVYLNGFSIGKVRRNYRDIHGNLTGCKGWAHGQAQSLFDQFCASVRSLEPELSRDNALAQAMEKWEAPTLTHPWHKSTLDNN